MGEICALHNMNNYMHFFGIVFLYIIFIIVVIYFIYTLYCKHKNIVEKYDTSSTPDNPRSYYDEKSTDPTYKNLINNHADYLPNHDILNNDIISNSLVNARDCKIRFKKTECTPDDDNCEYTFKGGWKENSDMAVKYITADNAHITRDDENSYLNHGCHKIFKSDGKNFEYNGFNTNYTDDVLKILPFDTSANDTNNNDASTTSLADGGKSNYISMYFDTRGENNLSKILNNICSYDEQIPNALPENLYKLNLTKDGDNYKISSITKVRIDPITGVISNVITPNNYKLPIMTDENIYIKYDESKGITMKKNSTMNNITVDIYKIQYNTVCNDNKVKQITKLNGANIITSKLFKYDNNLDNVLYPSDGIILRDTDGTIIDNHKISYIKNLFIGDNVLQNIFKNEENIPYSIHNLKDNIYTKFNNKKMEIINNFNGTKVIDKENTLKNLNTVTEKTQRLNNRLKEHNRYIETTKDNIIGTKFALDKINIMNKYDNNNIEEKFSCVSTDGSIQESPQILNPDNIFSNDNIEIWSTNRMKHMTTFKNNYSTKITQEPKVIGNITESIERMYPPTRNLKSSYYTISGQSYGNGPYQTWQSTIYNNDANSFSGFNAFNDNGYIYHSAASYRNGSYYGDKYIVPGYNGEWVKIKLPYAIKLTKYGFKIRGGFPGRCPGNYIIYGSNDNNNWDILVNKTNVAGFSYVSGSLHLRDYFEEIVSISTLYQYYAIVANTLIGRDGSDDSLNIDEWYVYGKEHLLSYLQSKVPKGYYNYYKLTFEENKTLPLSTVDEKRRKYNIDFKEDVVADILVVGGGGSGGGLVGGGGGAGGVVYQTGIIMNGKYDVYVGKGGIHTNSTSEGNSSYINKNGSRFVYNGITFEGLGGGGGATLAINASNTGGSGGGASTYGWGVTTMYGAASQGNTISINGINMPGGYSGNKGSIWFPGGGGGAGGTPTNIDGGNGILLDISGENKWYAAGGGGGLITDLRSAGIGGSGIGGNGTRNANYNGSLVISPKIHGVNGTGSGGGGGAYDYTYMGGPNGRNGGAGGSGVVIIRYYLASNVTYKYIEFTIPKTYEINFPENTVCDILVINNSQYIKLSQVIMNGKYSVIVGNQSKIQQNDADLYVPDNNLNKTDDITGESITYAINNPKVIIRYYTDMKNISEINCDVQNNIISSNNIFDDNFSELFDRLYKDINLNFKSTKYDISNKTSIDTDPFVNYIDGNKKKYYILSTIIKCEPGHTVNISLINTFYKEINKDIWSKYIPPIGNNDVRIKSKFHLYKGCLNSKVITNVFDNIQNNCNGIRYKNTSNTVEILAVRCDVIILNNLNNQIKFDLDFNLSRIEKFTLYEGFTQIGDIKNTSVDNYLDSTYLQYKDEMDLLSTETNSYQSLLQSPQYYTIPEKCDELRRYNNGLHTECDLINNIDTNKTLLINALEYTYNNFKNLSGTNIPTAKFKEGEYITSIVNISNIKNYITDEQQSEPSMRVPKFTPGGYSLYFKYSN